MVFLLLGAGVFAVDRWLDDAGADRVVTVTEEQLGAIRERWAAQWGRPPTGREIEGLIDEAVREEILYREAQRRGLDRGDPIIRRRLAQKMTFLLEDSTEAPETAAGDIETYFAAHAERYREPRRTTFRHVFLSREQRGDPERDAAALLQEVRAGSAATGGDSSATRSRCSGSTPAGPTRRSRSCSGVGSRRPCPPSRRGRGRGRSSRPTAFTSSR